MIKPYRMPAHELEGLRELADDRFILESADFLKRNFKSQIEHLGKKEQYQFIKEQFTQAKIYGVITKPECWKWLIVVMNLGTEFMHNPIYQDLLEPYLEKTNNKTRLNIEILVDEIINWTNLKILPRYPGIAPHLKDLQPVTGEITNDFAQGLVAIDKKKYEKIGFKQVVAFLEQEQKIFTKYQIADREKGYWYFTLAWYLGTDFLSNPCYKELGEIYTGNSDASEIDKFIKSHLQEKYGINQEMTNG